MIKIIKPGKFADTAVFRILCDKRGCEFTYQRADLDGSEYLHYIKCPTCGEIHIHHENNMIERENKDESTCSL